MKRQWNYAYAEDVPMHSIIFRITSSRESIQTSISNINAIIVVDGWGMIIKCIKR